MNYNIIYVLIFTIIMVFIYQNKRVANKKAKEILTQLESDFSNKFKVIGKVEFSKLHKLLDVSLNILYTENALLISGFDNYRDRQTTFIFYTDKETKLLSKLSVPKYLISGVEVIENDKIIIKSGDKIKVILHYQKYGKEKPQLREKEFSKLIEKLIKATTKKNNND